MPEDSCDTMNYPGTYKNFSTPGGEVSEGAIPSAGLQTRSRFFIPQCEPNAPIEFIQAVTKESPTIAFNLWKIYHSKRLAKIRKSGLHATFDIPSSTKIWLTSTAPDSWLEKYYSEGISKFKEDISCFGPDRFEGPDL